ncbi:MAG: hypothetical protein A3D33_04340 [Candidatus Rokubacteria bacterium RIFCSPHIGHO2_02_FULL_73_26]|nr:MAG: hypothetical protein A3D33_04340 [Candidatus Rokubacteria bacterium RIFCSPHIGHO2_02_FULL_73_26]
MLPVERDHPPLRVQGVDQLQDGDHAAPGVAHRHGEHRARAVAVPGVELAVEGVRSLQRDLVHVGDVDGRAGEGDVARDARRREQERLRREAALDLAVPEALRQDVVLGRREAQVIALADVHRPRLGARQASRLAQQQRERLRAVGLRRQRPRDALQLVLAQHARARPSRPYGVTARASMPKPAAGRPRARGSRRRFRANPAPS